jgi:hypothetical protein
MKTCDRSERFLSLTTVRVAAALSSVVDAKMCVRVVTTFGRSLWPRSLRRRSAAARMLRLWVRIPTASLMFVVCCQVELITHPEKSSRLWCVVLCDQEAS